MTNAIKAQIIVAVNAILACLMAFNVALTVAQTGAISLAINACLGVWVAVTYRRSPKRKP